MNLRTSNSLHRLADLVVQAQRENASSELAETDNTVAAILGVAALLYYERKKLRFSLEIAQDQLREILKFSGEIAIEISEGDRENATH